MRNVKPRKNGFVMLLVIFAFSAVSLWMIMLAFNSKVLFFQADRACLEASRQNLIASGLAWSSRNSDSLRAKAGVELDTAGMNIKEASLRISVISAKRGQADVEINTSCTKGEQKLTSSEEFNISVRP